MAGVKEETGLEQGHSWSWQRRAPSARTQRVVVQLRLRGKWKNYQRYQKDRVREADGKEWVGISLTWKLTTSLVAWGLQAGTLVAGLGGNIRWSSVGAFLWAKEGGISMRWELIIDEPHQFVVNRSDR